MNINLVVLFSLSFAYSCAPPMVVQELPMNSYNLLLQEKKAKPRYIFLLHDTAYYERRQVDKPSYFTDYDTLVRTNECECYQGKHTYLTLTDQEISLKYIDGREAGKILQFQAANDVQVTKWNKAKNTDKYRHYSPAVSNLLKANSLNHQFYDDLQQEWKKLLNLTSDLDQKNFDSVLANFLSKYSIR